MLAVFTEDDRDLLKENVTKQLRCMECGSLVPRPFPDKDSASGLAIVPLTYRLTWLFKPLCGFNYVLITFHTALLYQKQCPIYQRDLSVGASSWARDYHVHG